MRALIVTEKLAPAPEQRDGGARLVASLRRGLGDAADVMQFDEGDAPADRGARWRFRYPARGGDRFDRRLANADFIADRVREVAAGYTHVLFVHASMQLGFADAPLVGPRVWMFPMFLTPSYLAAGEEVPPAYTALERRAIARADRLLTPSHLELGHLVEEYGVPPERVRVVPRGVDRALLSSRARRLEGPPRICSVGSIKRQKNTLGLVRLFHAIRARWPGAELRVVGPAQDVGYAGLVQEEITRLGLEDAVELIGHVPPERLGEALTEAHLHLSASSCETFGRAIFETLASGLPNVAPAQRNAAAAYLEHAPYARFYRDDQEAIEAVDAVLRRHGELSSMALEIGELFDDEPLSRRIVAELRESEVLAVSDFDGTLFHKDSPERTRRCVEAFGRYPVRAVCSARGVPDLAAATAEIGVVADFLVGWSGAVVADGRGRTLWRDGLSPAEVEAIEARVPAGAARVRDGEATVQIAVPAAEAPADLHGLRIETYQGVAFVGRWQSSKLRAVHRLLRHLDWRGRVRAFGDGRYDHEMLRYFDGTLIRPAGHPPGPMRQAEEITHECD